MNITTSEVYIVNSLPTIHLSSCSAVGKKKNHQFRTYNVYGSEKSEYTTDVNGRNERSC